MFYNWAGNFTHPTIPVTLDRFSVVDEEEDVGEVNRLKADSHVDG